MTFEDSAYYWAVESQNHKPGFQRSEADRTVVVQASDMSDWDPDRVEWWFYSCGSDIYQDELDFERFICKIEPPEAA